MFLRGFVKVPVGVVAFVAASSLVKNQLGEFKNCFFFCWRADGTKVLVSICFGVIVELKINFSVSSIISDSIASQIAAFQSHLL